MVTPLRQSAKCFVPALVIAVVMAPVGGCQPYFGDIGPAMDVPADRGKGGIGLDYDFDFGFGSGDSKVDIESEAPPKERILKGLGPNCVLYFLSEAGKPAAPCFGYLVSPEKKLSDRTTARLPSIDARGKPVAVIRPPELDRYVLSVLGESSCRASDRALWSHNGRFQLELHETKPVKVTIWTVRVTGVSP